MTLSSAERIDRAMHPLFQAGQGGSQPTSALSLRFHKCDHDTFAKWNLEWHSQLPRIGSSRGRVYYVAEHQGRVYAVAMWSNPVARMLPQKTWMELRRFTIADDRPKNTASRMLGWMVRDIRRRFPDVVRLISYQDIGAHSGTIYRAAGWTTDGPKPRATTGAGWKSRSRVGATGQNQRGPTQRWSLVLRPALEQALSGSRRRSCNVVGTNRD